VDLSGAPLGDVTAAVDKLPSIRSLPAGVKQLALGDAEVMDELFASFGLTILMGIATKNSILLVEYAIVAQRDHGLSRMDALLDACHKRARPIIMTTLAMVAGMLPIAVGWGAADASFRSPMAVAVIGGLMTSTVLSLLVIPAVFTVVDDFGNWVKRLVFRGAYGVSVGCY
jgi:multidrug efflux pump subunit AcrB